MAAPPAPTAHLVVLDCNIYLDVARVLGEPFDWALLSHVVAKYRSGPLPNPAFPMLDSLFVVASLMSGRFAGSASAEVWISDHIEDMIDFKLEHDLHWSDPGRAAFFKDFVHDLVQARTSGDSIGEIQIPYGSPPLDHEDGLVFATVNTAGYTDTSYFKYCVTGDTEFCRARLPGLNRVFAPHQWVHYVRSAQAKLMLPK